MFVEGERDGSESLTSEFNTGYLDGKCNNEDNEEERVVEEVSEDIKLCFLEFSGINLIEDLHQDKSVKEDAVMLSGLCIPLANAD